jgi:hypothetical protein
MEKLQADLIKKTHRVIGFGSWVDFVLSGLLNTTLILLVMYILEYYLNEFTISLAFIIGFFVVLIRNLVREFQATKQISSQISYLESKNMKYDLYIPLLMRMGNKHILRGACICINKDKLFMEAFQQAKGRYRIVQSITVNDKGKLVISSSNISKNKTIVDFSGTLLDESYMFSVAFIPEVVEIINKFKGER